MICSASLGQLIIWISIGFCVTQSAAFSGLNLAIFSVSKLRLEVEAASGNLDALTVLDLRKDSNFTLSTIVWGNVVTNVLLTLLSDSVLTGLGAFLFSTFAITVFGDILPQAYFSRNALKMAARLRPLLGVYKVMLFPVRSLRRHFSTGGSAPKESPFFESGTSEHFLSSTVKRKVPT
jgi:metal transporter CNNM